MQPAKRLVIRSFFLPPHKLRVSNHLRTTTKQRKRITQKIAYMLQWTPALLSKKPYT